jgi:hypothetical protein
MRSDDISIHVYDAVPSDAAGILEIQKSAFYQEGILYGNFTLPPLVQTLAELVLDFKTYAFLKAIYEGKIVGSVRGRIEGDACHISRLIVHPVVRGAMSCSPGTGARRTSPYMPSSDIAGSRRNPRGIMSLWFTWREEKPGDDLFLNSFVVR